MINFQELKQRSKQKYQVYDGGYHTEYFDSNKKGYEYIVLNNIQNFDTIELSDKQKETISKITIATAVMNRNQYLIESIKTWIKLPFKKIVIVDWSSKKPTKEFLEENEIKDSRIEIIRVDDKKYYEHSKARNLKMKNTEGWVLSIDSDILLSPKFASCILLDSDNTKKIYMNSKIKSNKSLYGTSLLHKSEFDLIGGCNEKLHGWGNEDFDLFKRMINNGCKIRDIGAYSMYHIPHDDFQRTVNTKFENIYESLAVNNNKITIREEL